MTQVKIRSLSPLHRLRLVTVLGLIAFLIASTVTAWVPGAEGSVIYTRILCVGMLCWFVFFANSGSFIDLHRVGTGLVLSSVLLGHFMLMSWQSQMSTIVFSVCLIVMTMLCLLAFNQLFIKSVLLSWTSGLLFVAVSSPTTEIVWFGYPLMMYPLAGTIYLVGSELLASKQQLEQQKLWLEKTELVSRTAGWEFHPTSSQFIWSKTASLVLDVDDIKGHLPSEFVSKDDWKRLYRGVMRCVESGEDFELTTAGVNGKKEQKWYSVKAGRVGELDQLRVVGVFVDITETKDRERELTRARDVAESAVVARTRFLANMSHEIRTPMNGVIGMASLLLDGELGSKERSYAEIIRNSGESLLTIINEILDFSKYETGAVTFEEGDFDLELLVTEALDIVDHPAEHKGLKLHLDMPIGETLSYRGDSARLRQVLVNLLSNAVKFTEKGSVTLRVQATALASGEDELHFEVSDTGIGITPAALPHLFDPFVQGDTTTTRKFGGTGLGLAISREIVTAMGGEIDVYSHPKTGSKFQFRVRLPAVKRSPIPQLGMEASHEFVLVTKDQILVDILTKRFAEVGGRLECLNSIDELDQDLPKGIKFALLDVAYVQAAVIEDLAANPDVSLILLGPMGQRSIYQKSDSSWLRVPVLPEQLLISLKLKTPVAVSSDTQMQLEQFNHLRVLLAEDNAINQKVAQLMLKKLGCYADIAHNGRETIHMMIEKEYDLIFMDVQMPEVDGLEATRLIRINDDVPQPYIVAMTANVMQEDREICRAAGMNDFVAKPIRLAEISKALRRASNQINTG